MNLYSIDTGLFKLDGGAMFGVVPKVLWNKLNPADKNNRCTWAMRCLLVEEGNRLMLIDTGMGNKQGEKFIKNFEPHGDDTLEKSLNSKGFSTNDITDVLLTHLHFDHCGGAILRKSDQLMPAFKNATYWTSEKHWKWALTANPREKASFLKENILPIQENGQLKFTESTPLPIEGISLEYVNGHTEAMVLPHIKYKDYVISYAADLIPSTHHIKLPYIMGYDIRPMKTLEEKVSFLDFATKNKHIVMFEHDKDIECCTLRREEKGIILDECFSLSEI